MLLQSPPVGADDSKYDAERGSLERLYAGVCQSWTDPCCVCQKRKQFHLLN